MQISISKIKVRSAKIDDIENLCELETKCFSSDRISKSQYVKHIKSVNKIFIATYANKLLGSALLLINQKSKSVRLYSFAVDPNFREMKIGLKLFKKIEAYINRYKFKKMTLEVDKNNAKAIAFYKLNGLKVFSSYKSYYENGADAFRMQKFY